MAFPYSSDEKNQCLEPLMHAIRRLHRSGNTIIVGIQGGQGTGKTTLADYLVNQLSEKSYCVTSFSIDDFYTSYEERQKLAIQHPDNPWYQLFRGMPGTHRTDFPYSSDEKNRWKAIGILTMPELVINVGTSLSLIRVICYRRRSPHHARNT